MYLVEMYVGRQPRADAETRTYVRTAAKLTKKKKKRQKQRRTTSRDGEQSPTLPEGTPLLSRQPRELFTGAVKSAVGQSPRTRLTADRRIQSRELIW